MNLISDEVVIVKQIMNTTPTNFHKNILNSRFIGIIHSGGTTCGSEKCNHRMIYNM